MGPLPVLFIGECAGLLVSIQRIGIGSSFFRRWPRFARNSISRFILKKYSNTIDAVNMFLIQK